MDYDKTMFQGYVYCVVEELNKRNIKYQSKYWDEMLEFCGGIWCKAYKEHNDDYFVQCYYNLEEKHDRGIVSDNEWQPIKDLFYEENYDRDFWGD
jgi:hypothetical protein